MLNPVPQSTQTLGQTQAPILANFTELDTAFSVNHVGYNLPDHGKHMFIQFPQQGGDPGTGATEVALVAKAGTVGTQLFFQPAGGATSIEFTYKTTTANGYTKLPSGIILQWGFINTTNPPTASTFNFPIAFLNAVFSVTLTGQTAGVQKNAVMLLGTPTLATFQAAAYALGSPFVPEALKVYFFAVGY